MIGGTQNGSFANIRYIMCSFRSISRTFIGRGSERWDGGMSGAIEWSRFVAVPCGIQCFPSNASVWNVRWINTAWSCASVSHPCVPIWPFKGVTQKAVLAALYVYVVHTNSFMTDISIELEAFLYHSVFLRVGLSKMVLQKQMCFHKSGQMLRAIWWVSFLLRNFGFGWLCADTRRTRQCS